MNETKRTPKWLINVLLGLFGLLFALALVVLFLIVFPQFRPGYIQFTVRMGDIFFNHPEWVRPPENPDDVLATYGISWDEDGFRVPAWRADEYPVIAIGDSFTEAANVAMPWSDVLARELNTPVKNLGYRGFGPTEEAFVLSQLQADEIPDTVVIGYFEGNDLANVISSQNRDLVLPSEQDNREIIPTDFESIEFTDFRYPMEVDLGGGELQDIAFFEWYVWGLNATRSSLRNSKNIELLQRDFADMKQSLSDVCLVVAYFPSKPHIYAQYLTSESQEILMRNHHQNLAGEGEELQTVRIDDPEISFDDVVARFDNQRIVVEEVVAGLNMPFLDLTQPLLDAASAGEVVYYVYDTHWNQAGHDIVGAYIADYLESNPCDE